MKDPVKASLQDLFQDALDSRQTIGAICAAYELVIHLDAKGMICDLWRASPTGHFERMDALIGQGWAQLSDEADSPHKDSPYQKRLDHEEIEIAHRAESELPSLVRYHPYRLKNGEQLLFGKDLSVLSSALRSKAQIEGLLDQRLETLRQREAELFALMDTFASPACLIAAANGRVKFVNKLACELIGMNAGDLKEVSADQLIAPRQALLRGFEALRKAAGDDATLPAVITINRSKVAIDVLVRNVNIKGKAHLLCVFYPENSPPHLSKASLHSRAVESNAEPMVFTTTSGEIITANAAFIRAIGAHTLPEVEGRNLAQYLSRGRVDFSVIEALAEKDMTIRAYGTALKHKSGQNSAIEISGSLLPEQDYLNSERVLALTLRELHYDEARQTLQSQVAPSDPANDVSAKLGTKSLKDIIAETSEAIEKDCITRALELTKNNRAAAADMLGISRQSLYIKMRKLELLDEGE